MRKTPNPPPDAIKPPPPPAPPPLKTGDGWYCEVCNINGHKVEICIKPIENRPVKPKEALVEDFIKYLNVQFHATEGHIPIRKKLQEIVDC